MLQNLLGQEMVSRTSRLLNQLLILILGVLAQIHLVLLVLVVVAQMPRPGDGSKTHVFGEVQGFESKSNLNLLCWMGWFLTMGKYLRVLYYTFLYYACTLTFSFQISLVKMCGNSTYIMFITVSCMWLIVYLFFCMIVA
jgi:hypothetical protein